MAGLGKTYDQRCPLAMALDHVGERWTMLILRELLGGPARFVDLKHALDGVATNLLTTRLRRLEASHIVERREQHGAQIYRLTDLGEGLRQPLEALGKWGMMAGPLPGSTPRALVTARSTAMGIQAMLSAAPVADQSTSIELRFTDTGESLTIRLGDSTPTVEFGQPTDADATVTTSMQAIQAIPVPGPDEQTFVHEAGDANATERFVAALEAGIAALS